MLNLELGQGDQGLRAFRGTLTPPPPPPIHRAGTLSLENGREI